METVPWTTTPPAAAAKSRCGGKTSLITHKLWTSTNPMAPPASTSDGTARVIQSPPSMWGGVTTTGEAVEVRATSTTARRPPQATQTEDTFGTQPTLPLPLAAHEITTTTTTTTRRGRLETRMVPGGVRMMLPLTKAPRSPCTPTRISPCTRKTRRWWRRGGMGKRGLGCPHASGCPHRTRRQEGGTCLGTRGCGTALSPASPVSPQTSWG